MHGLQRAGYRSTTTPGSSECSVDPDVSKALSVEQGADQTMIDGKQILLVSRRRTRGAKIDRLLPMNNLV
ncbi:hypothetical protein BDW66DRAFT_138296 [Aspergillus desertorum]